MTDKKQVKGLLDYISLKRGEEAELAPNSKDYVFGMGLGATEEATREPANAKLSIAILACPFIIC